MAIRDIISGSGTGTVTDEMVCPVGSIIAYSGLLGSIPSNWHICDGTDGTPDLRDRFLKGASNAGDVDKYVSAGLPNITGEIGSISANNGRVYCSGAFHRYEEVERNSDSGQDYPNYVYYFDASHCSSVYGNSDTVMPNSYVVYYIMRMS